MLKISIPRGDIRDVRFQISEPSGSLSTTDFTEIYFTVKKTANDKNFIFQKTLSGGSIEKIGDGDYQLRIEPRDTNELQFKRYEFDIELVYENQIKQTEVGILEITKEITAAYNEG